MSEVIALAIINEAKVVDEKPTDISAGQAKYRAYFVTSPIKALKNYQAKVDTILRLEHCEACIVTA